MRRRITIHIDEYIDDLTALELVANVVRYGRVSDDDTQYCHAMTFEGRTVVYADKTKAGNNVFVVWESVIWHG